MQFLPESRVGGWFHGWSHFVSELHPKWTIQVVTNGIPTTIRTVAAACKAYRVVC